MLHWAVFSPAAGMLLILLVPRGHTRLIRKLAFLSATLTLALWIRIFSDFSPSAGVQFLSRLPWIPQLGIRYELGVDGLSLPLLMMTALIFWCAIVFSWREEKQSKDYFIWFLFLESACLGVFAALDLFLFYVFWDLTLVGMYFIIARWGHTGARAAALQFFIYTLVGSLAMLLAIIGLYLSTHPLSMDMLEIAQARPLRAGGWLAQAVFWGFFIGFAIKTPLVPMHTWLPPAHTDAPAPGSAILAAVLLKMGTYGFLRILLGILPDLFHRYAPLIVALGVVSVLYGALAALAQQDFKRMVAYSSINHMGYVIMAIGVLGTSAPDAGEARTLAFNGAVLQMVSHGLVTGALFLLTGVLWTRAARYDLDGFGGLARVAPQFAALSSLAFFAALGLPGLSGFVAEFQIFVGTFGLYPWAAAFALLGIVITAGVFLRALQRLFLGPLHDQWSGFRDLEIREWLALLPLLFFVILLGIWPGWLLAVINAAAPAFLGPSGP